MAPTRPEGRTPPASLRSLGALGSLGSLHWFALNVERSMLAVPPAIMDRNIAPPRMLAELLDISEPQMERVLLPVMTETAPPLPALMLVPCVRAALPCSLEFTMVRFRSLSPRAPPFPAELFSNTLPTMVVSP